MTRVCGVTVKAPRLAASRRESASPMPPKQRYPAEQATALQRSEAHYRHLKYAVNASFLMNGGRYF